jgi:hypothetical protein
MGMIADDVGNMLATELDSAVSAIYAAWSSGSKVPADRYAEALIAWVSHRYSESDAARLRKLRDSLVRVR